MRGNLWPSLRFTDDADLNRQAPQWCDSVANRRTHGTTGRPPAEMLAEEQPHLRKLPERSRLAPYLREDRLVARDGFVSWEGSRYGVHGFVVKALFPGHFCDRNHFCRKSLQGLLKGIEISS